jgi:hypothetical protein
MSNWKASSFTPGASASSSCHCVPLTELIHRLLGALGILELVADPHIDDRGLRILLNLHGCHDDYY